MSNYYPAGVTDAMIDELLGDVEPEVDEPEPEENHGWYCELCGESTHEDWTCVDCRCSLCPGCIEHVRDEEHGLGQCASCAAIEAGEPDEEHVAYKEAA